MLDSTSQTSPNNIEMLSTTLYELTIIFIYKSPNKPFCVTQVSNNKKKIFIGYFNSHSTTWGYKKTNNVGEAMEKLSEAQNLNLIHAAKLPEFFNNGS